MDIDYNSAVLQQEYNKSMKRVVAKIALICLLVIWVNSCQVGEFKDSKGKCQQCDISCYTCTSDGCKTCYDQMFPTTRSNTIICQLCYNILSGCDICLTSTKCQNCSAGYYLQTDNTCSPCNALFPNCLLCSYGNMTECLGCQAPFEPINGSCFLAGTQGRQPLTANNNQQQAATTQQQAAQSIPTVAINPPMQPSLPVNTINCDPNQILLSGKCYQLIPFCQTYNQKNGSCLTCIQSFKQTNGYCLPQNLVPFNNDAAGQTQEGQTQSSNGDIFPSGCSTRQYGSEGNCFDIGPQCLQFDRSNGTCYLCVSGFQPYNGLCIQLASNLQKQNEDSASQAPDNCGSQLPHCAQVNLQNPSLCFVCCDGYTFVDSIPGVCYSIN